MGKVLELFGIAPTTKRAVDWEKIVREQICPYSQSRCFKVRKSQPEISIGTCSVRYGKDAKNIIICPNRLLQKKQVFTDCVHLLTLHEPGNEFHVVSEVSIPGGSIDYFLVSARGGKVKDFVAIEFQALDTTGTVWPERQKLLHELGLGVSEGDWDSSKSFGMNWKMTAKTILVQLHHKIETIENLNKHLVLVVQDHFLDYMKREFIFNHLNAPGRTGDSMHIHSYALKEDDGEFQLELQSRFSTDADGIATCLGLQAEARIELENLIAELERKLSSDTLLTLA